jgi:hypothetical protein
LAQHTKTGNFSKMTTKYTKWPLFTNEADKILQTHLPITKAMIFFHILLAQHVSALNWVLFRCYCAYST